MRIELDDWQKEVLATKGDIALRSGRQVGKSTVVAMKAAQYAANNPNKLVMIVASVERQAHLLFEKTLAYMMDNYRSQIMRGKNRPTKSLLRLKNGSRIYSLPTGLSGHGIRGYTIDLLIADEAAFIPRAVFDSLLPALAITRGSIWLLSTPFGMENYFFDCFKDGTGYTTFHVSSEDCPRKDQEKLDRQKKELTRMAYAQEYLGEFVAEMTQFFPTELIQKCMTIDRKHQTIKTYRSLVRRDNYLGADIARYGGDETVLCSIAKINRDRMKMFDLEVYEDAALTETARKMMHLDQRYKYKKLYIDSGGLGAGVVDMLLENPQIKRRVVAVDNSRTDLSYDSDDRPERRKINKEILYTHLKFLMEQGKVQFFDDPEILLSLKSIQFEYKEGGRLRLHGKYSHIAEAIIRAVWGMKEKRLNIWIR